MNGMYGNGCFVMGLYLIFNYNVVFCLNGFWKMYIKIVGKFWKFNFMIYRKKVESKGYKRVIKDV